jgi:hypothetical protein
VVRLEITIRASMFRSMLIRLACIPKRYGTQGGYSTRNGRFPP